MRKLSMVIILVCNIFSSVYSQKKILLYPDSIFDSNQDPTIEAYLPAKSIEKTPAIIVIPGGAYSFLAFEEEGISIAKLFAEKGIAAFVLKYRLPAYAALENKAQIPLQDAQKALKIIRSRAPEWNLDPQSVGVIGFSAGGHLASVLGTHFHKNYIPNSEKTNLRPDFMILVYPVISMDSKLTHPGSQQSLLGLNPKESQIWAFSSDKQVSFDTPPTYLTHAGDDQVVDVNNSIEMYKALANNNIPVEMHLYPKGNHGFIQRVPVNEWLDPMLLWLRKSGFYDKSLTKKE